MRKVFLLRAAIDIALVVALLGGSIAFAVYVGVS